MVWTDYDRRALLPGSMEVGTASVPLAVDGAVKSGHQAWSVYVSNVYQGGRTAAWGGAVWLVLNRADVVSRGTVSVDLSSVLSAVGASCFTTTMDGSTFGAAIGLTRYRSGWSLVPKAGP